MLEVKIKELDRNNDMIGIDFIALMLCYVSVQALLLTLIKLINSSMTFTPQIMEDRI